MKAIPETNLADAVTGAATSLLIERRNDLDSRIKQILRRQEALAEAVRRTEREAEKLRNKLEHSSRLIERLKAGEWQVLAELEKAAKQPEQKPGAQPPQGAEDDES